MSHRCVVCQEEITDKEESYSLKFYNMALCRKHQQVQKIAQERMAKAEVPNSKSQSLKPKPMQILT